MPARSSLSVGQPERAQQQPARNKTLQQAVDPGTKLEDVEIAGHRLDPAQNARHRRGLCPAQRLDHVSLDVRREGRDRLVRGLLDHRLVDTHAFQSAGRGDGAVQRHLAREFEVDRAADVEDDGADAAQCEEPSSALTMFSHITLASANSIMVLSRKNSSLSTPA